MNAARFQSHQAIFASKLGGNYSIKMLKITCRPIFWPSWRWSFLPFSTRLSRRERSRRKRKSNFDPTWLENRRIFHINNRQIPIKNKFHWRFNVHFITLRPNFLHPKTSELPLFSPSAVKNRRLTPWKTALNPGLVGFGSSLCTTDLTNERIANPLPKTSHYSLINYSSQLFNQPLVQGVSSWQEVWANMDWTQLK